MDSFGNTAHSGSIQATGTPKAELYFTPANLFGHAVTLGGIARMSYWTKKGTTHVVDVQDWLLAVYTPYRLREALATTSPRLRPGSPRS